MNIGKKALLAAVFFLFGAAPVVLAYEAHLIYGQTGEIAVEDPWVTQYFYDELAGDPRTYRLAATGGQVVLQILVPGFSNPKGRYSFELRQVGSDVPVAMAGSGQELWQEYFDSRIREYYFAGPTVSADLPAGEYEVRVFSEDNLGRYVLRMGTEDRYEAGPLLNFYWQLPLLKLQFFKTPLLELVLTPFAVAAIAALGILVVLALFISYLAATIREAVKRKQAKTLLLTSGGLDMKKEIIGLLQKPAYNVTVAFINTAAKGTGDDSYALADMKALQDLGFNVQAIDISGMTEGQVYAALEVRDIIFVEGGNTFYLLDAMRKCNFERVIKKLLKEGIVYVGVSAGSIVAGKSIETGGWKNPEKNKIGMKNLRGLNLVPYNIFVHYKPEHADLVKQKMPNAKKRQKQLKILADGQALLVQGKETYLIGQGEEITV